MKWFWVLVTVLVIAAGCSDDDSEVSPSPSVTSVTTIVDYSGVALRPVPGDTTTTIVGQGTTSILGTVSAPGGVVAGATVRIERLVGDDPVRTDLLSGPDGRFELRGAPGGRYRVRAFLAPSLALVKPDVRFLRDGEEYTFDLAMTEQRKILAVADIAPAVAVVDGAVNLVAAVLRRSVHPDGIVRSEPVSSVLVQLDGLGRWSPRGDSFGAGRPLIPRSVTSTTVAVRGRSVSALTDSDGRVRFELRCNAAGPPELALLVPVTLVPPPDPNALPDAIPPAPERRIETLPLDLPDCVDPNAAPDTTVSDVDRADR